MPLNPNRPYPKRPRLRDKEAYLGIRGYFITINVKDRNKIFVQKQIVDSMIKYLREKSEEFYFDIVAYCFMPDHLHFVVTGQKEESNLLRFIFDYKQTTGYRFKQRFGFSLWATSFYDRVLRKNEKMKYVGQYVLLNPVKAGLVDSIKGYPYVGSFVYDLDDLMVNDPFLV